MHKLDAVPLDQLVSALHQAAAIDGIDVSDDRELARKQNRGTWVRHNPESVVLEAAGAESPATEEPPAAEERDPTPVPMPEGAQNDTSATWVGFQDRRIS